MAEFEYLREPKKDCVFCMDGRKKCRALKEMYCAIEIDTCRFYKSRHEYDATGKLLNVTERDINDAK